MLKGGVLRGGGGCDPFNRLMASHVFQKMSSEGVTHLVLKPSHPLAAALRPRLRLELPLPLLQLFIRQSGDARVPRPPTPQEKKERAAV